jgi:hypothetical protein
MSGHRRIAGKKADVLWCLIGFLCAQLIMDVVVDRWHPELYDEEYGARLGMLKARLRETPGRPLMLAVGSSRLGLGFQPELLPPLQTPSGQRPLVFNFSHLAAGPVMNLMDMRRLLHEGIRPQWLVLEAVPTCLSHEAPSMPLTMSAAQDLPLLQRYLNPGMVWGIYLRGRVNPWYKHRQGLLRRYAPPFVTRIDVSDEVKLEPLGGDRAWMAVKQIDPAEYRRRLDVVRKIYFADLQHYRVDPMCDRAMRELLELCRQQSISVILVLTPEGSEFRSWYSRDASTTVARYMNELSRAYGVAVVDARAWNADGDFSDSHHLLLHGAESFTRRLGRDVIQPFLEDRLLPTTASADELSVSTAENKPGA